MLEVARAAAACEGLPNATFEQADAQAYRLAPGSLDAVVGLMSAMFFGDKPVALANLAGALRPGGQLALVVWQKPERNPWFLEFTSALATGRDLPAFPPDGTHPFSLADPDRLSALVDRAGLRQVAIEDMTEPMHFGATADQAHDFMLGQFGWLLDGLDDDGRSRASDALFATLRAHTSAEGVRYPSAAWLVTARANGG